MLHGRERECGLVARLLDDARARRSGALVIRGEAGIGKSALLDFAAAQASDLRVLRGGGVESEAELPYAAMHQLLHPVRDRLPAIPAGQSAALRGAFGLGDPVEGDRFLVSVAVLSLLSEVAEERPLLCLVDDAHWLDGASADALAFVARRLEAEGVALLFAVRDDDVEDTYPRSGRDPVGGVDPAVSGPSGSIWTVVGGGRFAGLPELRLRGLDPEAARALLAERAGVTLAPAVADLLVSSTAGNPLALLEVPGSLSAEQLAGVRPLPERLPVGAAVEEVFLVRVRERSAPAQTLLLVAAAEESGDVELVLRAAQALGVPPDALDEAETAGLVRVEGGAIVFRHPLVRSAVYRGATFLQRRAVEQALAAALADEDVDRRAWHLAAAAIGPDEAVARELEQSAERAARRGGHAAAASALRRSAALTASAEDRARRLTLAAEAGWLAGQPDGARALLDEAAQYATDPRLRSRGTYVRGVIESVCGRPDTAYAMLIAGSEPVADLDPGQAARMLTEAGRLAWAASDHPRLAEAGRRLAALPAIEAAAGSPPAEDVAPTGASLRPTEEAVAGSSRPVVEGDVAGSSRPVVEGDVAGSSRPVVEGDVAGSSGPQVEDVVAGSSRTGVEDDVAGLGSPSVEGTEAGLRSVEVVVTASARLVMGLAAFLDGDAERAAPLLREGRALAKDAADPQDLGLAGGAALFLGADDAALELFTAAAVRARTSGAVSALPMVLAPLAAVQMWTGRFAAAGATASEGFRLAVDTGQDNPAAHHRAVLAWIAAAQGRAEECRTEASAALAHAIGQRLGPPAGIAAWALALLDLGEGRTEEAFDRLTALADAGPGEGHPIVKIFAAADLVEVATRTDRMERARAALDLLRGWAGPARVRWAHALVARCQGLLGGDAYDAHFTEALSLHAMAGRPFDTARTALLFDEALRRRRRRAEARRHLRAACETFERLDAAPWAEFARVELQATGETARKRDPGAVAQLTPQEVQITRLVSEGGTNREIAAQLFLSPRTVDYHLHKVFVKLGVSSRAELVRLAIEDGGVLGGR
ncbi:AAA family ATPase [Nonomuraea sp. NPDC003709]|uniref:helix-turn-helix transcriptional regulator n=1 Tax=Nonomuraea sp. NPDC003709 TaxID=3154450 RepID=UPI0033A6EB32